MRYLGLQLGDRQSDIQAGIGFWDGLDNIRMFTIKIPFVGGEGGRMVLIRSVLNSIPIF